MDQARICGSGQVCERHHCFQKREDEARWVDGWVGGWFRGFGPTIRSCLRITVCKARARGGGKHYSSFILWQSSSDNIGSLSILTTTSVVHLMEQKWWADVEQRLWSRIKHGTHFLSHLKATAEHSNKTITFPVEEGVYFKVLSET